MPRQRQDRHECYPQAHATQRNETPNNEKEEYESLRDRNRQFLVLVTVLALALPPAEATIERHDRRRRGSRHHRRRIAGELITVGFAQTGSESGWRSANTESMKAAFSEENGFELVFNAADNDPAAQIAAVRGFINQGVDAIVIAPIVEDGWEDVLQEAADAGIPVILEDRTVTAPEDLYATWVGLDFRNEGVRLVSGRPRRSATPRPRWWCSKARPVRLRPTTAPRASTRPSPAVRSRRSLRRPVTSPVTAVRPSWRAFSRFGVDGIDLVYAHNDDMALGAIEAIEAAGGVPGEDIQIVSIDAVHDGMQALIDGKINYIVECNPLLGELAAGLVRDVLAGNPVDKRYFVEDEVFTRKRPRRYSPIACTDLHRFIPSS